MRKWTFRIFMLEAALIAVVACLALAPRTQTQVVEDQTRIKIRVVEWAKCQASGTGKNADGSTYLWACNGLEMYRFLMSDGTIRGPFIAVPAGPDFVQDAKWIKR